MKPRSTVYRSPVGSTATVGIFGDVDFSTYRQSDSNPLELLRPVFAQTDIVVANVETVLSDRKLPPVKNGILLKSSSDCAEILRDIGVDCALLANNHIDDFGVVGVADTVENLESRGIEVFGLVGKNGISVKRDGINFNFTGYGTIWQDNSIVPAYGKTPGSVDSVSFNGNGLFFVHGFEELHSAPFPWRIELLKSIASKLRPAAVVCGHNHVYQGWIRRDETPICLSYGNGFMNLPYHHKLNPDSRMGCYSVMRFDAKGCYGIDEYLYRITEERVEDLSDGEADAFFAKIAKMHELLKTPERFQHEWEAECFAAWKPSGWLNWPVARLVYDRHRRIKEQAKSQNGVVYVRAMRAAYLKRQYGIDTFQLRDDEKVDIGD